MLLLLGGVFSFLVVLKPALGWTRTGILSQDALSSCKTKCAHTADFILCAYLKRKKKLFYEPLSAMSFR